MTSASLNKVITKSISAKRLSVTIKNNSLDNGRFAG